METKEQILLSGVYDWSKSEKLSYDEVSEFVEFGGLLKISNLSDEQREKIEFFRSSFLNLHKFEESYFTTGW